MHMDKEGDFGKKIAEQVERAEHVDEAFALLMTRIKKLLETADPEKIEALFQRLIKDEPMVAELIWDKKHDIFDAEQEQMLARVVYQTPLRPEKKRSFLGKISPFLKQGMQTMKLVASDEDIDDIARLASIISRTIAPLRYSESVIQTSFYAAFIKRHFSENRKNGLTLGVEYLSLLQDGRGSLIAPMLRTLALQRLEEEWEMMTKDIRKLDELSGEEGRYLPNAQLIEDIHGQPHFFLKPLHRIAREVESGKENIAGVIHDALTNADPRVILAKIWLSVYCNVKDKTGDSYLDGVVSGMYDHFQSLKCTIEGRSITEGRKLHGSPNHKSKQVLSHSRRSEFRGGDPQKNLGEIAHFSEPLHGFFPTAFFLRYDEKKASWEGISRKQPLGFEQPTQQTGTKMITATFHSRWLGRRSALPLPAEASAVTIASTGSAHITFDMTTGSHILDRPTRENAIAIVEFHVPHGQEREVRFPQDYDQWVHDHFDRSSSCLKPLNIIDAQLREMLPKKGASPDERFNAVQRILHQYGLYDMEGGRFRDTWEKAPLDQRLILMRQRAQELLLKTSTRGHANFQYAGICTDYSLLACDMLREVGIPAGVALGFSVMNGELSEKDAHATAYALLPGERGFGKKILNATPHNLTVEHRRIKKEQEQQQANTKRTSTAYGGRIVPIERISLAPDILSTIRVTEAFSAVMGLWYTPEKITPVTDIMIEQALRQGFVETSEKLKDRATHRHDSTLLFSLKGIARKIAQERNIPFHEAVKIVQTISEKALVDLTEEQESQEIHKALEALEV